MGSLASDKIVRPIRQLQRAAELIGRGEDVQPLVIKTDDEIEALAEEINTMNSLIQATLGGLEQEVEAKTREVVYLKKYTESILMSVPEVILIFDPDQKIDQFAVYSTNGLRKVDWREQPSLDCKPKDFVVGVRKTLRLPIRAGDPPELGLLRRNERLGEAQPLARHYLTRGRTASRPSPHSSRRQPDQCAHLSGRKPTRGEFVEERAVIQSDSFSR